MAERPIIVKKKIIKGHAHHGGSWKVAYADFVTAMMAFFMVMWLMNMSQDVKDQIQGYFNDPMGFMNTAPKSRTMLTMTGMPKPKPSLVVGKGAGEKAAGSEEKELEEVKRRIEEQLKASSFQDLAKNIKITITDEGLLIEFMETTGAVFFESGSAVIRPEALKLVASIAPILTASKHPLEIQGHTDAQPFLGSPIGNWKLSSDRAESLMVALSDDQVPDHQFTGIKAFGSTRLLDPEHPNAYTNRRVTILLPRKYTSAADIQGPADLLHAAMSDSGQPEAVVLKPGKPNLFSDGKP